MLIQLNGFLKVFDCDANVFDVCRIHFRSR
jgi:hypothetical protein